MKKDWTALILLLATSLFIVSCGSNGPGTIKGQVVSEGNKLPIADVQIILCNVPEDAYEHLICTLVASPTTVSDSDGNFQLADVPAGSYIVMIGLPGVLEMTPEQWGGIEVTRGSFCMQGGENSVCDIEGVTPSEFWTDGALQLGTVIDAFSYTENEIQPGVVILANAEPGSAAEDMHIYMGSILSNHTGILVSISGGQYSPAVNITGGKTVTVEIKAPLP